MLKIRSFIPSDIKKLTQKIDFIESNCIENIIADRKFAFFPLSLINEILPLHIRFIQQNYVAVNKGELLGLIGLMPDNKNHSRWMINRLILDKNTMDIGKQLVNYVVNKYGGAGVQSFVTAIEATQTETINLFNNGCGFRYLSEIDIWKKKELEYKNVDLGNYQIREIRKKDIDDLLDLDTSLLYPQFRVSLKKSKADFDNGLINSILDYLRNNSPQKFIVKNSETQTIEGLITLNTNNKHSFYADILVSLTEKENYEPLIAYVTNVVKRINPNATLYIYERKYYQCSLMLKNILSIQDFQKDRNFKLLVKDYWKPSLQDNEYKKPSFIIIPDITRPACKR